MIAVILCGGQSTRMGTDKGMLKLHDNSWAQFAVKKFTELQVPVVVSVNAVQFPDYAAVFDAAILVTDDPQLDIHGPLGGLLGTHLKYPMQDLFVLACDMPLMETETLQQLLDIYHKDIRYEAILFSNNGEPEPLCAIYTARGLSHIMQLHQNNQLEKHSMKSMLQHLNTFLQPLTEAQVKQFRNFNEQTELNGL